MTANRGQIILVDDDAVFANVFSRELGAMGFDVRLGYGTDFLAELDESNTDIVILDLVMPGRSGLDLLKTIRSRWPDIDVIMLTGNATVDNALASMKVGAYDFFTKPVELERIEAVLRNCLAKRRLRQQNLALKSKVSDLGDSELGGESPAMREIRSLVNRFAPSDSTVLLCGESGTGKELVAQLIHRNSPRRDEPFIIVDCTALKDNLLESELFGHERGAFTDAVTRKHGIFEIADGGTVFLDEIGDLSPALQVKLLRVVETKSFRRLGGTRRIQVDVRIVAATHHDLAEQVRRGAFREDLYYRINVVSISIPPLREHPEDVPRLVEQMLSVLPVAQGRTIRFSKAALESLAAHRWPGNVRELRNVVERCVLLADGETIEAGELPLNVSPLSAILSGYGPHHFPPLQEIEDEYIRKVLEATGGNKQLAAKILGIDRKTIQRRLGGEARAE